MLQQTRVETVIDYYTRWMTRFPTLATLAAASTDDVNSAWSGLGYYRRARMLHEAAQHVHSQLNDQLPDNVTGLLAIRGIGPYTAGAVASIAFGQPVPLVDGNVSRVLARLRAIDTSPKHLTAIKLHWHLAQQLATATTATATASNSNSDASDWNQALMELGAVVCMPRVAECGKCPVRRWCRTAEEVAQRARPISGRAWRVSAVRKRVEVELEELEEEEVELEELEEEEVEQTGTGRGRSVQRAEEKESLEVETKQSARKPNQRKSCGRTQSEPAGKKRVKSGVIELNDTPCNICDTRSAPPKAVIEYPSKAVKKPPLDEHVSVCVISRTRCGAGGEVEWLLVQRPVEGLLAGQWEFPSVVHPPPSASASSSSSSSVGVAPSAAERRRLLTESLSVLLPASLVELVLAAECQPVGELVHVFSHRRHLMHVQRCRMDKRAVADGGAATGGESNDGRRWCWMTESELTTTGLTTGQRKVWALSRGAKVKLSSTSTAPAADRRKRNDAVEEVGEEEDESEGEQDGAGEEEDEEEEEGEQQSNAEADEEWEVWPAIGMPEGVVVEDDGVIVID